MTGVRTIKTETGSKLDVPLAGFKLGLKLSKVLEKPLTAGVLGEALEGLTLRIRGVRVGSEVMIEGNVFLEDDDQVLNRCRGSRRQRKRERQSVPS